MQNRYIVLALAALLGAFSCNTREEGGPRSVKFQAVQGDTPVTRTVLQTDGSVFWSPGDAINLYYGASGATRLVSDNQSAVAQTTFSGTLDGLVPNGQDDFWAVYPYDETNYFNGSAVTVSVPGVQPAISGTFAPEAFISMARSKDYTLQFYNLCGGVQFSVTKPGVQAVVFRGNNEEFLAGTVQASFGQDGRPMVDQAVKPMQELRLEASENGFEVGKWYYLVSLPATLSAGYTMTFMGTDGEVLAERVSEKPVTIKRSVWGILADADDVAEPITASKYLTFTSEGTTTISMVYSEGNVVPSFSPVLYYSTDRETWTQWDLSPLSFTANAPLYMCGDNPETVTGYANGGNYYRFSSSGAPFAVSGDAMSLMDRNEDMSVAPSSCFAYLFSECTDLTLAPSLPATTLESGCYQDMFDGCTSLREAPELSAMTLAEDCYRGMFARCTTLTAAPVLPATTLKEACYRDMFQSCGELTAAPELPAATLVKECYRGMFDGCFHLSYVKCLATDISAGNCLDEWLSNVSSTGTFVKAADMNAWSIGASGIPEGWTVRIAPETVTASKYLTFTSEGTTTISMAYSEGSDAVPGYSPVLFYSTDQENWTQWDYSPLTFTSRAPLYLCGDNPVTVSGFAYGGNYYRFITSGDLFAVSGDAMSLMNRNEDVSVAPSSCFTYLFSECTNLTAAPTLPATTVEGLAYGYMFMGCTSLREAPALPATTIGASCYFYMFQGCSALSAAPELPATAMEEECYLGMFWGCTSLREAPALPATSLANRCYWGMFQGCTGLTAAPELPATTLVPECYYWMFFGCTQLSYVKCLATDISAEDCLKEWLYNVSSTGTFVKAAGMDAWPRSENGIPQGWGVVSDGETPSGDNEGTGEEDWN